MKNTMTSGLRAEGEAMTIVESARVSQTDQDVLRAGVAYANQWVEYQQDRRDLPGVVVAIWHDDRLLLSRGYGYADLERQIPMTPRHIFRVASHSKTFTATAVMQLMEQGKLRLDDPLARPSPGWSNRTAWRG